MCLYARKTEHCATVALWTPAQEDEPHYISDMVLILMWYIFSYFDFDFDFDVVHFFRIFAEIFFFWISKTSLSFIL